MSGANKEPSGVAKRRSRGLFCVIPYLTVVTDHIRTETHTYYCINMKFLFHFSILLLFMILSPNSQNGKINSLKRYFFNDLVPVLG